MSLSCCVSVSFSSIQTIQVIWAKSAYNVTDINDEDSLWKIMIFKERAEMFNSTPLYLHV